MDDTFKKYKRTNIAEMRPITEAECEVDHETGQHSEDYINLVNSVSISGADLVDGLPHPKIGDMVARNPKNHDDQWLVAKDYFRDNFAIIEQNNSNLDQKAEKYADEVVLAEGTYRGDVVTAYICGATENSEPLYYEASAHKDVANNLSFGQAIEALKQGKQVARASWQYGVFVFKQIPAQIGLDIIPKMQSVPQSVKDHMVRNETELHYTNQCAVVLPSGRVDSWAPTISDVFAEDWMILT